MLRWVDCSLIVHEEFVGLYKVDNIEAATLVRVLKDCLIRFNISLSKIRGQCFDGASNMSGIRQGVAALLRAEQPKAYFTHCYGHCLSLATSDMVKACPILKKMLDTVNEITKLVKYSPRRQAIFEKLKQDIAPGCPGIRVLCPTRWTVKADSMRSIIDNYSVLEELWEKAVSVVHDTEVIARIGGVRAQMETFEFFFGLLLGECLFRHSDNLSRTLQKKDISASEGQVIAKMTVSTLQSIRTDECFAAFWEKVKAMAAKNDIGEPRLPRRRKRPRRFEEGEAQPEYDESPENMYRRLYFEALDLLIQSINTRFDQPGYQVYCSLQNLLINTVNKRDYSKNLEDVIKIYGDDFDLHNLKAQLQILSSTVPAEIKTIFEILHFIKDLPASKKEFLNQIIILAKLILVMLATNSSSERSFSAMRRIKTYLRSTMLQERLNSLMVIHVHKELTDNLNMKDVANEFVQISDRRLHVYGKFQTES